MNKNVNKGLAELIGTFALTFIGGAAIINGEAGLVGVAIAHGLTVAVMVSAIGHISGGHINPAATVGFMATGKMSLKEGGTYIVFQLVGATLAALCLKSFVPGASDAALGGQSMAVGVTFGSGVAIEIILTFFLVFTVFATAVDERGAFKAIAGFGIGLVVAFDILAGGPVTGASMNPARSFGPALVAGQWDNHLVYWLGPLIGGAGAAIIYNGLFLKGGKA
jgi:MIP family channel proteins